MTGRSKCSEGVEQCPAQHQTAGGEHHRLPEAETGGYQKDLHRLHHGGDAVPCQSAGGLRTHMPQPGGDEHPKGSGAVQWTDQDVRLTGWTPLSSELLSSPHRPLPHSPSGLPQRSNLQVNAGLHHGPTPQTTQPAPRHRQEGEISHDLFPI